MPKIDIDIAPQLPDIKEGEIYTIAEAEVMTTAVKSYKGIRVTCTDMKNEPHGTMLWLRGEAGEQSKVGAFITALGKDTDAWISKHIQVVAWRTGNRKIQVVQ